MPELIAQGSEPQLRWRRRIPIGESFVIGRASGDWSVPWDNHVSRSHVTAQWDGNCLVIEKLATAKNPVFYQGSPTDKFSLPAGQHFVIGATLFTVVEDVAVEPEESPIPMSEQTYSSAFLRKLQYRDSSQRVAVLGRLPEVIAGASDDIQLFKRVVDVLLSGIPEAASVAIVEMELNETINANVLHWDRRDKRGSTFTPSRRLVQRAIECDESVLHVWEFDMNQPVGAFTMVEDTTWSFATPVRDVAPDGKSWCIYVAGKPSVPSVSDQKVDKQGLQEDMKFTELAASTIANLIRLKRLERSQTSLRQFFSPVVLKALAGADPEEVLSPRETNVAVLFCDLQGFSRINEQYANDLMGLLGRVSRVLGLTTHEFLEHGGVVGDFHGDAAMGFWGWPIADQDYVERACRAALAIRRAIGDLRHDPSLKDFRLGVGVATGPAVAGKIGTADQVKVTVFGPVVNLASRLESMTRRIRAPILIDEVTAQYVRDQVSPNVARVRRVAPIMPYGMDNPTVVHELLPPHGPDCSYTDEDLGAYEQALGAFLNSDWETAWQLLQSVPADDVVKDFLTIHIAQHGRKPPANWDRHIHFDSK